MTALLYVKNWRSLTSANKIKRSSSESKLTRGTNCVFLSLIILTCHHKGDNERSNDLLSWAISLKTHPVLHILKEVKRFPITLHFYFNDLLAKMRCWSLLQPMPFINIITIENYRAYFFSRLPAPVSRNPFANGLLSILSWVIFSFWYAVTAINSVSRKTNVLNAAYGNFEISLARTRWNRGWYLCIELRIVWNDIYILLIAWNWVIQ